MPQNIRILNPIPGGNKFCSQRGAEKHVRRGTAKWVGSRALRFIKGDHRVECGMASAYGFFVDGTHYPTLQALAHIPVLMPVKLITGKRTPYPRPLPRAVEESRIYSPGIVPWSEYRWPVPYNFKPLRAGIPASTPQQP